MPERDEEPEMWIGRPSKPERPRMFIIREGLIGFLRDLMPKNRTAKR